MHVGETRQSGELGRAIWGLKYISIISRDVTIPLSHDLFVFLQNEIEDIEKVSFYQVIAARFFCEVDYKTELKC